MSKYCLFLIVIFIYLTGGNNSMSRFFKFGKVTRLLKGMEINY